MAAKRRKVETQQVPLSSDEDEAESSDYSSEEEDAAYVGLRNSLGNPHGRGTMTWSASHNRFEGRFCNDMKEGKGCFYFADGSSLSGVFKNDLLEGQGVYTYPDGSRSEGTYAAGELNGYCREFDLQHRLVFTGHYKANVRCGFVQVFDEFGGSVAGTVDVCGSLTCSVGSLPSIAYIYPDGCTALVGAFSEGRMVAAKPVRLQHPVVDSLCIVAEDEEGEQEGEEDSTVVDGLASTAVGFDESTADTISTWPLVGDRYERDRVFVRASNLPSAGEGLFARRDLHSDEVVSFYNGVRVSHEVVDAREWALNSNTISLDASVVIDVPRELARLDRYCASLGHKANHSFTPNCEYAPFQHPRFGAIKCIRTLSEVAQGKELTCDYGYNHKFANSDEKDLPDWYTV